MTHAMNVDTLCVAAFLSTQLVRINHMAQFISITIELFLSLCVAIVAVVHPNVVTGLSHTLGLVGVVCIAQVYSIKKKKKEAVNERD